MSESTTHTPPTGHTVGPASISFDGRSFTIPELVDRIRELETAATTGSVSVPVAERGQRVCDLVCAWVPELRLPEHPLSDRVRVLLECRRDHAERGAAGGNLPLALSRHLVGELLSSAGEKERQTSAIPDDAGVDRLLLPVYLDGGTHVEGFVFAGVDQYIGARFFPVAFPYDVVELGLTQLGPLRERIRFFSELTSIYCDAVRLSGQVIGLRAQLLPTLRDLTGILGELVRRFRLIEGDDSERQTRSAAEQAADGADPSQHVFHTTSPSVVGGSSPTVGDGQVAEDAGAFSATDASYIFELFDRWYKARTSRRS